ncbi:MAG: RNA polymerase sigma factor [Clostridia bacterium]|nr:RNA polymerase sigma factor [Clostridia bacterium]
MDKEYEALLAKHRVVVERYINYRMPSTHDADDVIQETYLAAYLHFGDLKNRDFFKQWLLSIARNQCNLWYRRRKESVPIESVAEVSDENQPEYDDTVDRILQKLPSDMAEVLRLYHFQDMSQSEISEKLGIPLGTVKSRLFNAKKLFKTNCPPEVRSVYERSKLTMKNEYTRAFPENMPELKIEKKDVPFFEVKFADEAFIVPRIGNKNSEGTYRYPNKKLVNVSTCYVPKRAYIHDVEGVQICRDTYNVKADQMYRNEAVWFVQLTDEYQRDLGTVRSFGDDEYPTAINTFLEEDYDNIVNCNDRIHGKPLLVKENPVVVDENGLNLPILNERYTMGVYDVTIGKKTFEIIKICTVWRSGIYSEYFVDRNGRLVLLRWYDSDAESGDSVTVNGTKYYLTEDRISEYAL